jgi:hypothetical protein
LLELSLQCVLVVLLLCSIGWSALVHRRLVALRRDGGEIGKFVVDLAGATTRAENAIRQMREASADTMRHWQRQRVDGEQLAADLRRAAAEADMYLRELHDRLASARQVVDGQDSGRGTAFEARAVAESPSAAVQPASRHEQIRRAIKDLR